MAFPFCKQDKHECYETTFLQSTIVNLKYNSVCKDEYNRMLIDSMTNYFKDVFALGKPEQDFYETGLSITNVENDFNFVFNKSSASIRLGRKKYINFLQSMMFELTKLKIFIFGILKRTSVHELEVRKINLFGIKAPNDQVVLNQYESIFKSALSHSLVNRKCEKMYDTQNNNIVGKLREHVFIDEDVHIQVKVRIAITRMQNQTDKYNIVLDTSATYTDGRMVQEGSVDRDLIALNAVLYDAYHWCVSSKIIEYMKKKKILNNA